MKISFNPTTNVQVIIPGDNDRIVQNSSGNKVYLYGIEAGWKVKATFTRRDGFQIGLIGGVYDLDPDDEYCYIIPIPEKATEVDKGLGLSILIYEPSGTTFIRHSTIATSMYVYTSTNVIVPDDLDTVLYDAVMLAISNLTESKLEHSALVGTTAEIAAGIDKDTEVYTMAKTQEVVAANSVDDKAYTDTEVAKIVGGTYIADNATKDADGNVISATYEKVANKKTTLNDNSDDYYPTQKAVKTAVDLKLSKDLSGLTLTDDGLIASNDLIYVYTNDGVPTKVSGRELTQLIKTITMNPSTYVLTITKYDGTQTTIDLPAEMAFVSASYSDVTQDLTFTLQNGTTVAVPLDDLVSGLASEDWVALNYVAKTQIVNDLTTDDATKVLSAKQGKVLNDAVALKVNTSDIVNNLTSTDTNKPLSAKQGKALEDNKEALTNKATNFSVVNDIKYPTTKAVKDLVDATLGDIETLLEAI